MIEVIEPHTHTLATIMPDYGGGTFVECQCGAAISGETEDTAIAAWNRRMDKKQKSMVHGRWIRMPQEADFVGCDIYICSNCNEEFMVDCNYEMPKFCPECGARMDGGDGE